MDVEALIGKWWGIPGGAERANFPLFIGDLCKALGLPEVEVSQGGTLGSYQFEAPIAFTTAGERDSGGRIDLYRRGCFVLEAKQSRLPASAQPALLPDLEASPAAPSGARYDKLMREAFKQAEGYARALPAEHGWPPYLIVCDVGRAFEIYFDWSGMGKAYGYFPDKASYRIELPRLRDAAVADRLRKIWLADAAIDPRKQSAEVTRDVARRLALVSEWLEKTQAAKVAGRSAGERSMALEQTSLFLMRVLFCMFAEDVGLLPEGRFKAFLEQGIDDGRFFEVGLREIFDAMGKPGRGDRYSTVLRDTLRYFNGNLFTDSTVYNLSREDRGQLYLAAKHDWSRVEPAIFGTLLEQALVPEERAKLGAHYPFPILSERHSQQIANIAEELDQTRKLALGECPDLTMTGLYNLLDGQRAHSLSPAQQKDAIRGRVGIIGKLHQDLDAAVAQAYGWPADLPASEIVSRLVALNAERAAEEAKGTVQWLRPDYQIPRFSKPA